MIEKFINRYPLSKTLQFSLIPIGNTEKNFNEKLLLAEDELRAENYEKVKKYIDSYHKYYIDKVLSDTRIDGVDEYAELFYKKNTLFFRHTLHRLIGHLMFQLLFLRKSDLLLPVILYGHNRLVHLMPT